MDKKDKVFRNFEEFYPFYLGEHSNRINRRLHIIGTTLGFLVLIYAILLADYGKMWYFPVIGYGFAWFGHFFFEKNRPATFKYPLMSFRGDMRMWYETMTGIRPF